jgi:thymidylate synthase
MIQNKFEKEEEQYYQLIKDILHNGTLEQGRNGNTISIFGSSMHFSLQDNKIPLLTSKHLAWKTCLKELLWFISGSTDNSILQEQNVHIWDGDAKKASEFNYIDGDLGPIYGHQWRHFNAEYVDCHSDYSGKGIDQLNNVINDLKNPSTRSSRRHIITAWNPYQLDEMALPPCHILMQFNVRDNKYLSCALMQRSIDTCIGAPINIASYSFLTHIIAKHCGLIADEFIYFLGNAHIYEEHFEPIQEQLKREPFPFPKINILQKHDNIEDYTIDDIEWVEKYVSHEPIKMIMKA